MSAIKILDEAIHEGMEAGKNHKPNPMIVGQAKGLFGNDIVPGTEEVVSDGVCGFAWISIYPKSSEINKQFIKDLKYWDMIDENKNGLSSTKRYPFSKISYLGPVHYQYWVSDFAQSMEKKEAFAKAFVEVLKKYGISASYGSRMD
jgi:hypothetical protein